MKPSSPFQPAPQSGRPAVAQGNSPRKCSAERGVMLIEVLVSILIFSFGILGTVALYARAVQYSTNAEDRSRAALLASEIATAMWLRRTNDVTAAGLVDDYPTWVTRVATPAGGGIVGGIGSVSGRDANGTVTITIAWTPTLGGGAQHYVTQVTM